MKNGCWLWTGRLNKGGYAKIKDGHGRTRLAHRVAYELLVGPIPEGLQIDHLCRVRHCCNPAHLEPVTCRENLMRGVGFAAKNAAMTHCKRGHEFTPENTYVRDRMRRCRTCCNAAAREARQRAAA